MLTTMLKQRRESVEQFRKGNRPELAAKEQAEIVLIEGYLPKAAGEDEVRRVWAIDQITKDNGGTRPVPKDMGAVMKVAQQRIPGKRHSRRRADGQRNGEGGAGEVGGGSTADDRGLEKIVQLDCAC